MIFRIVVVVIFFVLIVYETVSTIKTMKQLKENEEYILEYRRLLLLEMYNCKKNHKKMRKLKMWERFCLNYGEKR